MEENLKELIKTHKQSLTKYQTDMEKAIYKALCLDYFETTVEEYKKKIQEVVKNENDL